MKYFKESEFACKCGCGALPEPELMEAADKLREQWGLPIYVTSGKRCEAYNRRVGGARNSYHVKGLALDVRINHSDVHRDRLVLIAGSLGFRAVGHYKTFTHLDRRVSFANWHGRS